MLAAGGPEHQRVVARAQGQPAGRVVPGQVRRRNGLARLVRVRPPGNGARGPSRGHRRVLGPPHRRGAAPRQRAAGLGVGGGVGRVLRGPLVGAAVALGADRRVGRVQDQAEVRGPVARDHGVAAGQVVRVRDQQLLDAVQPGDGDLPADQQVRQQGRDRGPVGADERLQLLGGDHAVVEDLAQVAVAGAQGVAEVGQVVGEARDGRAGVPLGGQHRLKGLLLVHVPLNQIQLLVCY